MFSILIVLMEMIKKKKGNYFNHLLRMTLLTNLR